MMSMSYPSSIRNAKLENTGYGWKVKLPNDISDQTGQWITQHQITKI